MNPTPFVNLAQLKGHIRTLITLEETEAPVLSCYVNRGATPNFIPHPAQRGARALRKVLRRQEREPFQEALDQIEAFLENELHPLTMGIAAFSRAGSRPFFLGLQFQMPLPNRLSVDSTPNIYDLVELKDTYHRYVVLIASEERTRILEVNLGAITRELWTWRPELRERVGRDWTRQRYQSHRRDRGDRLLKETIDVLEKLVSAGGHTHLILAGSARLTARVRNRLPRHVAEKLIDIVSASASDRVSDVVAATLSSFIEREEQESLDAVAQLVGGLRRGGLAVAGTRPTLEALRRGQADVLVMAKAYQPPPGWECEGCGWVDAAPYGAERCPDCGSADIRRVNVKEELVRLAEELSAEVEFVSHSDTLMELGGVGCMLRYVTSEREVMSPNDCHRTASQGVDPNMAQVG